MYPFLESIRLENQQLHFIKWHEQRFVNTQIDNWGEILYKDLEELITTRQEFPKDNRKYKCRLVYSPASLSISFLPYTPRVIHRLQIVHSNTIDYHYKSTDRSGIDILSQGLLPDTELLIFKNGLLTDSSFSNLALFDGQHWWTPKTPLLKGVHRSDLLDKGIIREKDIPLETILQFGTIRLMNAMMDWESTWELPAGAVNG